MTTGRINQVTTFITGLDAQPRQGQPASPSHPIIVIELDNFSQTKRLNFNHPPPRTLAQPARNSRLEAYCPAQANQSPKIKVQMLPDSSFPTELKVLKGYSKVHRYVSPMPIDMLLD